MSVASKLVLGCALLAACYVLLTGVAAQGQPNNGNEPWLEPSDGMLPKMPDMLPQPSSSVPLDLAPARSGIQPTPFSPVPTVPGQPSPLTNPLPPPGQPVLR